MSYVDFGRLKSPADQTVPFLIRRIPFTTAQLIIDTQYQFGMLARVVRIVNNDGVNNLTFRLISPSNVLDTVQPNTEATAQEWTSFIEINPNAGTGTGLVEIELVRPEDAYIGGRA
jgi:hypothetical protein